MCLSKEKEIGSKNRARISPWRQLMRQEFKPKLSRDVVRGARINLNRYWSKFEELSTNRIPLMSLVFTGVENGHAEDNVINENIVNEQREFVLDVGSKDLIPNSKLLKASTKSCPVYDQELPLNFFPKTKM